MIAVAGGSLPRSMEEELVKAGHQPFILPPSKQLGAPVATHADLLLFAMRGTLYCYRDWYEENSETVLRLAGLCGLSLCPVAQKASAVYPLDSGLCAVYVPGLLVCDPSHTPKEILSAARKHEDRIVSVKQGYTACNLCTVPGGFITEDDGIAAALKDLGLDVLHIEKGSVSLPPYPYGFFGGACGCDGSRLYVCGDLSAHPQAKEIRGFCSRHGVSVVHLPGEELADVGKIFFL